ncbi:MAG: VWA domain-containing protein [Meiothermus sp.]|nr:VWA domain-containing protein [Meiothermus sp.]
MSFLLPLGLLGLLTLPLLAWLYWRAVQRGRSEGFALLPGLELASRAAEGRAGRRHLTAGLYLLAAGLGIVALARPHATVLAPDQRAGIVLALDVSGSMRAADIPPNRLEAAKKSAEDFVSRLPDGVKVGVVSFAGTAQLEAPLTAQHLEVIEKIRLLDRRYNTAIGEGLMESLRAFPARDGKLEGPATVILLSDGQNRMGVSPEEAAREAARLGVRVHTIGVGTVGSQDPGVPFAGFDEGELRGIADATDGRYYAVNSAGQLESVYRELGSEIGWVPQRTEVSGLFTLAAGLVLGLCLLLATLRRRVL